MLSRCSCLTPQSDTEFSLMPKTNPYSPHREGPQSREIKGLRRIDWCYFFCAAPAVIAIYLCFAIAALQLKRLPIPGQDTATEMGGTAMTLSWSLVQLTGNYTVPAFAIVLILQLLLPGVKFRTRLLRAALGMLIPVNAILFLVFEPSRAFWWILYSFRK